MARFAASLITVLATLPVFAQTATPSPRPIVVQGAMPAETEKLAARLANVEVEKIGGWTFWRGTVDGYPVIVSKTMKGMANAAAATVLAVERFRPIAIVNQGTAGGHDPSLKLYDIVIGETSVSLAAFKSPFRARGAGTQPLDWVPMNLMASEGSAGNDPRARAVARFPADPDLLAAARSVKARYTRGRVVDGVIGSSDMWHDEVDMVTHFHDRYGSSVEEMETSAAAQIAGVMNVRFLGIRVVSDNITNGSPYDRATGEACQEFVYEVVKAIIPTLK